MGALKSAVKQQFRRFTPAMWVVGIAALAVLAGGQAAVIATKLITDEPLRARKLQTLQVVITDRDGHPVDGATIAIDGGMPPSGRTPSSAVREK